MHLLTGESVPEPHFLVGVRTNKSATFLLCLSPVSILYLSQSLTCGHSLMEDSFFIESQEINWFS